MIRRLIRSSLGRPHSPLKKGRARGHDRIPIMERLPALTDEQKRQIYDGVINNARIPITPGTAEPGTVLPGSVAISDLDPRVTDQIPVMRGYKCIKLHDKVLIVSPPPDRIVVGEVER